MSLHSENVYDQAHYVARKYYYFININENFPFHGETVTGNELIHILKLSHLLETKGKRKLVSGAFPVKTRRMFPSLTRKQD